MKRIIVTAGAALLAAVPVTIGLVGNTSFAQSVPVFVPAHAIVVDDSASQSKQVEQPDQAGDDKGGLTTHTEAGDDKGGLTTQTDQRIAASDDKVVTSGSGMDDTSGHVGGGHDSGVLTGGGSGKDDGSAHQ